jgi:VanZ family protein
MDSASGRRSKLAFVIAGVAAVYWLAMFVGTHLPVVPDPNKVPNSLDKLQHLIGFAGLAALLCMSGAAWFTSTRRLLMAVLGVIAVYGVIDEWTQSLVPHREPDLRDWVANMLGAGLGISVYLVSRQLLGKHWP